MQVTVKDIRAAMTYGSPIAESFDVQGVQGVQVEIWRDECADSRPLALSPRLSRGAV